MPAEMTRAAKEREWVPEWCMQQKTVGYLEHSSTDSNTGTSCLLDLVGRYICSQVWQSMVGLLVGLVGWFGWLIGWFEREEPAFGTLYVTCIMQSMYIPGMAYTSLVLYQYKYTVCPTECVCTYMYVEYGTLLYSTLYIGTCPVLCTRLPKLDTEHRYTHHPTRVYTCGMYVPQLGTMYSTQFQSIYLVTRRYTLYIHTRNACQELGRNTLLRSRPNQCLRQAFGSSPHTPNISARNMKQGVVWLVLYGVTMYLQSVAGVWQWRNAAMLVCTSKGKKKNRGKKVLRVVLCCAVLMLCVLLPSWMYLELSTLVRKS